MHRKSNQE